LSKSRKADRIGAVEALKIPSQEEIRAASPDPLKAKRALKNDFKSQYFYRQTPVRSLS